MSESGCDRLLDRLLVTECIYRYGWAYDERNSDILGGCFAGNAIWEGSTMGVETVGPFRGRDAIMDYLRGFWNRQEDQRRHMFTNVIINDLSEMQATAYAYLLLVSSRDELLTPVTAGPYQLTLRKEDDVWRISHLLGGWDTPT